MFGSDCDCKTTHSFFFFLAALGLRCCAWAFFQLWRVGAALRSLRCSGRASHCGGFSCCGAWALGARASVVVARRIRSCGSRAQQLWLAGSRAQAQQLWCMGLVDPRHVGSSRIRARTHDPCIGSGFLTTAPPGESCKLCFYMTESQQNLKRQLNLLTIVHIQVFC